MGWHPRAVHRPLPGVTPPLTPTAAVTHSDAGYVRSLYGWWTNPASGGLSCHAHISWEGELEQYIDTARVAYAQMEANWFGLSCEVSNSPDYQAGRRSFDDDPYSDAQIRVLVDWWTWACVEHPTIARLVCVDGRNGFGWHDKFPQWTTPGHVCPGRRRIEQLQQVVFPAVFAALNPQHAEQRVRTPQEADKMALSHVMIQPGGGASIPVPPPHGGALQWDRVFVSFSLLSGNPADTVTIWAVVGTGSGFVSLAGLSTTPVVKSCKRTFAEIATGNECVNVTVPASSPGPVGVMIEARMQ